MGHDVFISHSSKNKLIADAICHVLEANGIPCWIAPRDVRAGFEYPAEIIYGIENCRIMVLIFSEDSNASKFVYADVSRDRSVQMPKRTSTSSKDRLIPTRILNSIF